jgi:sugar phosphate isomerase/epimerase
MIKLAYPVATPEVRGPILGAGGPIERVCAELCAAGYAAIEPFTCNPEAFDAETWVRAVERSGLAIATVGTGPVVADDKLTFTAADEAVRCAAVARAKAVVRFAARCGAQMNIGKLRGDLPAGAEAQARDGMRAAFAEVCAEADRHGVTVTLEPQNRTIINNLNTTTESLAWLRALALPRLRLMLDVFHMAHEGEDIPAGFAAAREALQHVHFADTARRVPGDGAIDFRGAVAGLRAIGYDRFITVEIKQEPDVATAARRSAEYVLPLLSRL